MKTDKAKQSSFICRWFSGVLKTLVAVAAIVFAGAAQAAGDYEDVGGVRWYYEGFEGYCSVVKGENVAAVEPGSNKKLTVPKKLGGLDVKRIGQYAFYNLKGITNVTIQSGVEYIGNRAFSNCEGLQSVEIPDTVTEIDGHAFVKCTSLTSVTLPYGVTSIALYAFMNCTSLKTAYIPVKFMENQDQIGKIFNGCSNVDVVYCGSQREGTSRSWCYQLHRSGSSYVAEVKHIRADTAAVNPKPSGSVTIPSTLGGYPVQIIGNDALYYCPSLTGVTIPSAVTNLGTWAFGYCRALTSIDIPNNVKNIDNFAFCQCTNLTSVTIGSGVKRIGEGAFLNCSNLSKVSIPGSMTIEARAFESCTKLKQVYLPVALFDTIRNSTTASERHIFAKLTSSLYLYYWDSYNNKPDDIVGYGEYRPDKGDTWYAEKHADGTLHLMDIAYPVNPRPTGSVAIPQSICGTILRGLGYGLRNLTGVTQVEIPKYVTSVGEKTFEGCTGLKSVTIGNSVTNIAWGAFNGCTSLESVTIPTSVTRIEGNAFKGCSNLSTLKIWSDGALAFIGVSAFEGCAKLKTVSLPESTANVGDNAFRSCTGLETVYLPTSLYKYFETDNRKSAVFQNCSSSLKLLYEGTSVVDGKTWNFRLVGPDAVEITGVEEYVTGTLWIPEKIGAYNVVSIGEHAFEQLACTRVRISSDNNLTNIADYAFYMSQVEDFSGFSKLVSVGKYAFSYTQLGGVGDGMEIEFPDTVKSIGLNACQYCTKLKWVSLPGGLYGKLDESQVFGGGPDNQRIKYRLGDGVFAQIVDGVGWSYKVEDDKATVTSGNYLREAVSPNDLTTYTVPKLLGGYQVAKIGPGAFNSCKKMQSVTFPSGITAIQNRAFYDCTDLATMTLPTTLTEIGDWAFYSCKKLTTATIPGSVQTVGEAAFYECSGLKNLTISSGVKTIGASAFTGCTGLTSVSIPSSVETIDDAAFYTCTKLHSLSIAKGVKTIGGTAFGYCRALEEVIVPDDVESLGGNAFMYCTSLQVASLPRSLYGNVDDSTFNGCPDMLRVFYRMGENTFAEKVGDYNWCYQLEDGNAKICYPPSSLGESATYPKPTGKLVIPESINGNPVTAIGYSAFMNCKDVTEVVIPEGVTTVEQSAFSGCSNLETVSLPDSLKIIYSYAFMNCSKLKNIALPSGLEQLWFAAFSGCTSLQQVTIPGGVKEIKGSAFQDCTSLTEAIIQEGVETIGASAFQGCTSLKTVTIPSTVTSIGEDAFKGCPLEVVNVPAGKSDAIAALLTASGFTVTPGLIKEPDPGKWTITFVPQGGVCTPTSMQVTKGASLEELPTMMKDKFGYKFVGWFTEAEGGIEVTASTVPTADATYYAHWSQKIFTVTFDANGGSPASSEVKRGENATLGELPAPTLVDYTLVGWFTEKTGGTKISADTVVTADVTYYAHWEKNAEPPPTTYTVTLDPNGGTCSTPSVKYAAGSDVGDLLPVATREGYKFEGWYTSKESWGALITPESQVTADVTYYAHWLEELPPTPGYFKVTLDANGGSVSPSEIEVVEGGTISSLPSPIRDGYTFDGWFTQKSGGTKVEVGMAVTGNITYYAHWTVNVTPPTPGSETCTVQFNPNDGTCDEPPRTCEVGTAVGALPDASRAGYEFVGWFTSPDGGVQITAATLVTDDVTFYAHWNYVPTPVDPSGDIVVDDEYGAFIPGVFYSETIDGAAGCTVKGLPTGMKWTAKDTTDSKTKKFVRANSFYGVPTKPGTFTVTFSKKGKNSVTAKFVVRNMPNLNLMVSGSGTGSVPGSKSYQAGKAVTVKASPTKGSVFQGWYEGDKLLSESASYKFTMGMYDTTLTAIFRDANDDADAVTTILATKDEDMELDRNITDQVTIKCGVKVMWQLGVAYELSPELSSAAPKVAVSGLPTGLKFTAKDIMKKGSKTEVEIPANTIYGTPTKSGKTFKTKITITTPRKTKVVYNVDIVVLQIDRWAIGPYEGYGWNDTLNGVVSITVAETGKISGKFLIDGKTWTLSAANFDDLSYDYDEESGKWYGTYIATVTCKSGNESFTEEMFIDEPLPGQEMGYPCVELAGKYEMMLWQTFWKFREFTDAAKAAQKSAQLTYTPSEWTASDSVTLKFGANGTIKTAGVFGGNKVSGSAALIPMELPNGSLTGPYEAYVFVYFPKNDKKGFKGYFEQITLRWDGTGFKYDE